MGGFCAQGVVKLIILEPGARLNANMYIENILKPVLNEINGRTELTNDISTTSLFGNSRWTFQQDGAPAHTAKRSVNF